jgi:hypothetical protein
MRMAFRAQLQRDDDDGDGGGGCGGGGARSSSGSGALARQVIKVGIEPDENDRTTAEGEAEASFRARHYAELYNAYSFNKRVEFLPVTILQLVERRGPCNFATMEQDLSETGAYYKWNDNNGDVSSSERRTPEAFSHFSLEVSGGKEVCVDIQGVVARHGRGAGAGEGYLFTDPQIHSVEEGQFGIGNCGRAGIEAWQATHRCNHLCRELRDAFLAEGRPWTVYRPDDDYTNCDDDCAHRRDPRRHL